MFPSPRKHDFCVHLTAFCFKIVLDFFSAGCSGVQTLLQHDQVDARRIERFLDCLSCRREIRPTVVHGCHNNAIKISLYAIIGHLVERGARLFIVLAVRILFLQIQFFMLVQICRNALILLGNRQFTLMVLPRKCPGIAYTLHTALSSVSSAGTLLQYSSTLRISWSKRYWI